MARKALRFLLAGALLGAAAGVFAAPFAMVTDLKGDAWAIEAGKPKKLTLLGYIENPTEIRIDGAGKLALTYFSNGVQYDFSGPSRVAVESGAPRVLEGAAGGAKKVTPEKGIGGSLNSEQWRRLQQATVVMRNVKSSFAVLGPDRTTLVERAPEFEWTPAAGARSYRVVVYGPNNDIIHESTTEQSSARLSGLDLQPGKRYRWKVDALGVSKPVSASGSFTVADDAVRERLQAAKQSAGKDLGPRSFYATLLEAEGHGHDARAEWKSLARDYPEEQQILERTR